MEIESSGGVVIQKAQGFVWGVALTILTSLLGCSPCSDRVISKSLSGDGLLAAAAYERNCGATTDYSTVVNVQRSSAKLSPDDGTVFVAKGRHDVKVRWTGARKLSISCTSCSREEIYREVVSLGDVDISLD